VLFTHDLDFGAILAASPRRKPSVVQLRTADVTPETTAHHVFEALRGAERALAEGALVTIEPARHRIRLLPLKPE
jgi:predicted nuclease of predicted toxin-antitoxin system